MANRYSRSQNMKRNIGYGLIEKAVILLTPFIINTIMVKKLGVEYGGLTNSLKSAVNILLVVHFGFESAVISSMYVAFSADDTETICAYATFLKHTYHIIGWVLVLACAVFISIPSTLFRSELPVNIQACFLLFVSEGIIKCFGSGYLWAIPTADQRGDLLSIANAMTAIVRCIIQCAALTALQNYYLYAAAIPIAAIWHNYAVYRKVMSDYPYLKTTEYSLDSCQKNELFKKIKGVFFSNLAGKTRNELDAICVSAFIGLTVAGIYGNYIQMFNGLNTIFYVIITAIVPSIGSGIAGETSDKNHNDMKHIERIYIGISGFITVCLLCLYQPFMCMWMGQELLLQDGEVFLLATYFYILRLGDIRAAYYQAAGLWYYGRHMAFVETVSNIVLNIILCRYLGVTGIIFATLITVFFLNYLYCPIILYKCYFKNGKLALFYTDHIRYSIPVVISAGVSWIICQKIPNYDFSIIGVVVWIAKGIVCGLIYAIFYALCRRKQYAID